MVFGSSFKISPRPVALISLAMLVAAQTFWVLNAAGPSSGHKEHKSGPATASIAIDYPLDKSIFPPEITPPTFLWRDPSDADRWVVEVSFQGRRDSIRVNAPGEHWVPGEADPRTGMPDLARLPAKQAATRTWKPDATTWAKIKSGSVESPATIAITGIAGEDSRAAVSTAQVTVTTSRDRVDAPIFYRDVPLMTVPNTEKGSIQPLPPSALPLIKWRLRNVAEPQSRVVMENLYTCANCHSFSRDGKTLGIDVDGPKNDKGLYALVPVEKNMAIRNQNVIRWSSFQEDPDKPSSTPAVKRYGFMPQVSPDGRYVVTSIGPPGAGNVHQNQNTEVPGLADRLFSVTYNSIAFTQVFYPTRGILAWYDRQQQKLRPLPGADDPHFVQTSAFWSPDGKYLVFSRAVARDPYPDGAETPTYANDPREPQIQYDLYRIPFHDGKGGKAEPVEGASGNGMSNDFPKVSPDGRWIVFVQNRNGLLMRPDSKLYMVPFQGGTARPMNCNTSRMNSWHSFSPNGRWLAFSSKARSPFTQLMLTHIDANGNDSPAILVDNTTASNRAVNIPEFVNIPMDGMERIEPQAAEVYRVMTVAFELTAKQQWADAIVEWRKALEMDPDNANAHFQLAGSLTANNQKSDAAQEYKKACELDPRQAGWFANLAVSLAQTGDTEGAIASFRKSLELDPSSAEVEAVFGAVLAERGQIEEGLRHMRKAVELSPDFAPAHSYLGTALAKMGRFEEAIEHMQAAIRLAPNSTEYEFSLGFIRKVSGDYAGAAAAFEKSVELSKGKNARCMSELAEAYDKLGRFPEAVATAQSALELAVQEHDGEMERKLRADLEGYRRGAAK